MSDDISDQDRDTKFKQFLRVRLFGLVAAVDPPRGADETYPMASGVIIDAQGVFVLVTVAHYLKDVIKWEQSGRLAQ